MSELYIEAKGLVKSYGTRTVVKGIDLNLMQNEIVAIIGPNGAGKSTTLEMILGIRKPDAGVVKYWWDDFKKYIGVQLQATPFFPGLSAVENLKLFASFYKVKLSGEQIRSLLEQCGLQDAGRTDASKLSGGQQKRLAIAITLVHNPDIIFLDEPTAALDPRARKEIRQLICELVKSGKTIVFTSHDMEEVSKTASRVILINDGQIMAAGTPDELCKNFSVQNLEELYLKLTA